MPTPDGVEDAEDVEDADAEGPEEVIEAKPLGVVVEVEKGLGSAGCLPRLKVGLERRRCRRINGHGNL